MSLCVLSPQPSQVNCTSKLLLGNFMSIVASLFESLNSASEFDSETANILYARSGTTAFAPETLNRGRIRLGVAEFEKEMGLKEFGRRITSKGLRVEREDTEGEELHAVIAAIADFVAAIG